MPLTSAESVHDRLVRLDDFGDIFGDLFDRSSNSQVESQAVPNLEKNSVLRRLHDGSMEGYVVFRERIQIEAPKRLAHSIQFLL